MSYDIWLEADLGGDKPITIDYGWNYTSNCGPMWRLAGADLAEFDGQLAADCIPALTAAIADMEKNPDRYLPLNPSNGWGSLESLIPALRKLLAMMLDAPQATIRVWR